MGDSSSAAVSPLPCFASVIIPAKNAEQTLGEQLEALVAQVAEFPWEILVVDNGSTDRTPQIVETYRASFPALRLIRCERPGANAARNEGVMNASAERLLFCDADDCVAPGWVAALAAGLESYELVGGHIDNDSFDRGYMPGHPDYLPVIGRFLPRAIAANLGVRRSAWAEVGGFSETYQYGSTDTEFCWRVQLAGFRLGYVPEASVAYRARMSLKGAARKAYLTGKARPLLYRDFRRFGMPRSSVAAALVNWVRLIALLPGAIVSPRLRWNFVRSAAAAAGRVVGSFQHRVVYL